MSLLAKLEDGSAILGVVGLGYVGLPLSLEFAKAGYRVVGFDVDEKRVAKLNDGISYVMDVSSTELRRDLAVGRSVGEKIMPSVLAYIRDHELYR
mgnify:CR=1 FL=1